MWRSQGHEDGPKTNRAKAGSVLGDTANLMGAAAEQKPRLLLLGDRSSQSHRLINLGDSAMLAGARHLLETECGCELIPAPWKPFPYFTHERLRQAARTRPVPDVFDSWGRTVLARHPLRSPVETAILRWAERSRLLNSSLVARLEARVGSRYGLGLLQAAKPYLLRHAYAARFAALAQQADAAVFLGGGVLADHILKYSPAYLFEVYLAGRLGRKVIAASQTLAATDPLLLEATRHVYGAHVARWLVREPISHAYAMASGYPAARLTLCPDFAFGVPAPGAEHLARRLPAKSVALVIRGDRPAHPECWAQVVRHVVAGGRTVHVVHSCEAHDAGLARCLAALCPLQVPPAPADYPALIGQLSGCDLVITDRFHVAVFATLAGVPVVPVQATTFKLEGLMRLMDYPLPVAPVLGPETLPGLMARIDEALANRTALRQIVEAARERLTASVRRETARAVRDVLSELRAARDVQGGRPCASA